MSYFSEISIKDRDSGYKAGINSDKEMAVVLEGKVDDNNSSTTALDASGVFTGEGVDTLDYALIVLSVKADQDSATNGLQLQKSYDASTWETVEQHSISASTRKTITLLTDRKYFRAIYTNGVVAQSSFGLEVMLKKTLTKPQKYIISEDIEGDEKANLNKSVLTGLNPSGDYENIKATGNNSLKTTPYHEDGTEGILLSGVKYEAGKNGIDPVTGSLITIPISAAGVHAGKNYSYRTSENVASSGFKEILVVTPDTTKWAHMVFGTETLDSKVVAEIFETTVTSDNGTLLTALNRNRNESDNNTTLIYDDPTVTADGDRLAKVTLGAGKKIGGSSREYFSRVLKQNTKYLMRITETGGSATDVNWELDWIEQTNID